MVHMPFNATAFQPRYGSDGGGLPVGRHKVIIDKTEMMPTKDNPNNGYLAITLKSIEGASAGQSQIDRLNLYNVNPQTVAIANDQLAAYCVVTGKLNFNDTSELHNIPFFVDIAQQRSNPDYTEVKKLYDINGNEPGKGAQAAPAAAPSNGPPAGFAASGGAPWAAPTATQEPPAPAAAGRSQPSVETAAPWQPAAAPWQPAAAGGGAAPGWGPR